MGNILGRIGSGKTVIMMDSHTDTVGVGDPEGMGLGSLPGQGGRRLHLRARRVRSARRHGQHGVRRQAHQGARPARRLHASTWWGRCRRRTATGCRWLYILKEDGIRPDCVVITEPSRLGIYRGHRGRMEIEVHLRGKSCHASAPERGDNPIYKMSRLVAGSGEAEHAAARRSVPGQGHHRGDGDPLAFAIAVRGAGRVLDPPGPAA